MTRPGALALACSLACAVMPAARADEGFDAAAYDKKAFEWSGLVEARPERQELRRDAAGYLLQYPGDSRRTTDRLGGAAELTGVLRRDSLSFSFTGHASWIQEPRGSDDDSRLYEAYGAWQVDEGWRLEIGKRALRWGKGYAWSPVAFLERPKDPTDPELAREGFVIASAAWVRAFDGPVQTLSLVAAVVPASASLNTRFGGAADGRHANAAFKLYGLILDTDIDLVWAGRGSRGPRLGVDFSRNLGSRLEVHAEWARAADVERVVLAPGNALVTEVRTVRSTLVGLRYLTARDTTIIAELYRSGGGYRGEELSAFYDLVKASAGNAGLSQLAGRAAAQGYNRPQAAQRYAYLRVSQKEPFDLLDVTPSITIIADIGDRSWSAIPELLYTGVRNVELRVRLALNGGGLGTEFGERAVRSRADLRMRMFF